MLLSNSKFLISLQEIFEGAKDSKTVYMTMKRCEFCANYIDSFKENESNHEFKTIVRVVCAKKKISTLVEASNWEKFNQDYISIAKYNMDSLKKKKRK